jgi:hypothetical protein
MLCLELDSRPIAENYREKQTHAKHFAYLIAAAL